jgi:hypothetical protein
MGWKRLASMLLVCLMLSLSACGGGGGGDTPSASPSVAQGAGFTVDRSEVVANVVTNGPQTSEVIRITPTDARVAAVAAGWPTNAAQPFWLQFANTGIIDTRQLVLNINPSGQLPGTRKATVRLVAVDAEGDAIGQQDITITLNVVKATAPVGGPNVSITANPSSVLLQGIQGGTSRPQATVDLSLSDNRVVTLVTSTGNTTVSWLSTNVSHLGSNWQVSVNAAAPMQNTIGDTQAPLRVLALDIDGQVIGSLDIPVTLRVQPRLMVTTTSTSGLQGWAGSTTHLHATVNILADTLQWQARVQSSLPAALASTAGSGSQAIDLDVDLSNATPADSSVTIVATASDGQQTQFVLPVRVLAPVLNVGQRAISLSAINGAAVSPVGIALTVSNGTDPVVTVSTDTPWLKASQPAGNKTSSGFQVLIDTNAVALANGTHVGHVNVSTTSSGVALTQSIPVTLVLTAPSMGATSASLSFSAVNGTDIAPKMVTTGVSNGQNPVVAVTADVPWLKVTQSAGNTASAGFLVTPDPSLGPLASGTHQGHVTVSTTTGNTALSLVIPVQLQLLAPSLTASVTSLQLGGDKGRSLSPASLSVALSVPLSGSPWTVTSVPAWLSPSRTGGTFQSGDNSLSLTPKLAALTPGQTSGNVVLGAQVNGDKLQVSVPVTVRLDQHKLIPSEVGLAFTQTPAWSRLSKTLTVRDNMNLSTPWTATSDQPWLTVTPSGNAGQALKITANPTGLSTDVVRTATVTLKSTDATVATPEKIRVGLWVGSGNPGGTMTLSRNVAERFVLDPIRPLMYTTVDGEKDLVAYNLYTGKEVSRLNGVLDGVASGLPLGNPSGAVSPDGSRLYLYNGPSVAVVIDLDLFTRLGSIPASLDADSVVVRPNGKPLLLGIGQIWDVNTGAFLGLGLAPDHAWVFAQDLSSAYGVRRGMSPGGVVRTSLDHSLALSSPLTTSVPVWFWDAGGSCASLSLSPDGSTLAAACAATSGSSTTPSAFTRFNLGTGQALAELPAPQFPNNVQYTPDGRLVATVGGVSQLTDFWVYNADSSLKTKLMLNGGTSSNVVEKGSLRLSADGFLAVLRLTSDGTSIGSLKIVPLGP